MIILGIDPGIATVGFGIIKAQGAKQSLVRCGVIRTKAGQRLSLRLAQIYSDMTELIDTFQPDAIAVEELFFNTNTTTAIAVARGAASFSWLGRRKASPCLNTPRCR